MALFCMVHLINHRSSGFQMFFKIGALKNLVIFTGKNLCWSRCLIKLQAFFPHSDWIWRDTDTERYSYSVLCGKKAWNFVKKRLQHRCFPVSIPKCLRTAFSTEHRWLFLNPEANLETSQTSTRELFFKNS